MRETDIGSGTSMWLTIHSIARPAIIRWIMTVDARVSRGAFETSSTFTVFGVVDEELLGNRAPPRDSVTSPSKSQGQNYSATEAQNP